MSERNVKRYIHLAGTIWFAVCVAYVLVVSLRQAKVHWWVLFSVSGYGIFLLPLLISLYLFAIFRGISSSQIVKIEHPLTTTSYYVFFYAGTPFLGGLAGCLGTIGVVNTPLQFLTAIVLGTLATTFLVWVVIDPITSVLETLLSPSGHGHRLERLARERAEAQRKNEHREHLLAEVLSKERQDILRWRQHLRLGSGRLAELITTEQLDARQSEREAISIGVAAWRMGGLRCMQVLRDMTLELAGEANQGKRVVDYISFWWDGIGTWQRPSVQEVAIS